MVRPAQEQQRLFTVGSNGGWQVRRPVSVPGDVCDLRAFEAGYASAYMRSWNNSLGFRDQIFEAKLKRNPQDPAARHNYELYKGKRFDTAGGSTMRYAPRMDRDWHLSNACEANSYRMGENAGIEAANEDYRALRAKEIR
jgi:hypothetical protein